MTLRWVWTLALVAACTAEVPARDPEVLERARRCDLPGLPGGAQARTAAARCAEAFVARNGYLDALPAGDTMFVVAESDTAEVRAAAELVRERRGTLEPQAHAVCERSPLTPGWVVLFHRRSAGAPAGVSMSSDFSEMRALPAADAALVPGTGGVVSCQSIDGRGAP